MYDMARARGISWRGSNETIRIVQSRIRNSLNLGQQNVYNTIIQPIFDYADISWGAMLQTCKTEMPRLQNIAARIVVKSNRTENCFPSLKWLHLSTRRKVHRCILIYKILNGIAPTYLDNYFVKNVNIHNFNTRRKENFVLPRVNRELGKKTFRFQGAKDYNELPTEIKNSLTLASFKNRIKQHYISEL